MKITYTFIMKVLPALLAALCWTSCSDFLEEDPKGQLPSDTYFSNKEDLDASLTALYSVIASSQASNNLCGTNFLVGDDISTHPSSNKQPLREHDQFDVKDNNSWLSSMWEQRFKVLGHRDTSPDLDGSGEVEPKEYIKACPCFDVRSEFSNFLRNTVIRP